MHPCEWGSWDNGIAAFTQTLYLGTSLENGQPVEDGSCIQNYYNLGYILGTSSNLFTQHCIPVPSTSFSDAEISSLEALLTSVEADINNEDFAVSPNPFHGYSGSLLVSAQTDLYLVDGGLSNENNPIWPFIQPARTNEISVLIVNDNSADTADNFPNETEIYTTYVQAQQVGLSRMSTIPPVSTFLSEGFNNRATFFGCNDNSALTVVYLPNVNYTYPSNQPTLRLQYDSFDTAAMIANGNLIGTQNGDENWPTCLGCAIVKKTGNTLPTECSACFIEYCYS
jgi:lysophospholipase